MDKRKKTLTVALPFFTRNKQKTLQFNHDETKKNTSTERSKVHRQKVKNNPVKLAKYSERKKAENKRYKDALKEKRKSDPIVDNEYKIKVRKWKRDSRKRKKVQIQKQKINTAAEQTPVSKIKPISKESTSCIRKCAQRAKETLPMTPKKWSKTMAHLIRNASPRRKKALITLQSENESPKSHIQKVILPNKPGRPKKTQSPVKRFLAYNSKGDTETRYNTNRYLKRKEDQISKKTKCTQYKNTWSEKIIDFLNKHSRIMPNKKDTVNVNGERVAKRHLLCSKLEAYKQFKEENPTYSRKFTTFYKLIPKNYHRLDEVCRRICVCAKDYANEQQIEALNKAATAFDLPQLKLSVRDLSKKTLCTYERFPKRECIDRVCTLCGSEKIFQWYDLLTKASENHEAEGKPKYITKWHQWEQITTKYTNTKNEIKTGKSWQQVQKSDTVNGLVKIVAESMSTHSAHIFRADYQYSVMSDFTRSLPLNHCFAVMDFSENINLQPQDEIESAHWTQRQVTLHPIYVVRHDSNSTVEKTNLIKESYVMISDNLKHDASAVYAFTKQLLVCLKQNAGPSEIKVLHRFTDNCAAQYKCKEAFSHLNLYRSENIQVVYHYSESGHGKGPSDGIGATIKNKLERMILAGRVVNNAYEAYLALANGMKDSKKTFKILYMPSKKMCKLAPPKNTNAKTLKGTQKFHLVQLIEPDNVETHLLLCKDLGCACPVCLGMEYGPCYYGQFRNEPAVWNLMTGKTVSMESLSLDENSLTNNAADVSSCSNVHEEIQVNAFNQSILSINDHNLSSAVSLSTFDNLADMKGLKVGKHTPSDGNCFFWAMSDQFMHNGFGHYTHEELRARTTRYLRSLSQEEKVHLESFLDKDFNSYLNDLQKDGTYADHVCIEAVCKLMPCVISILHSDGTEVVIGDHSQALTTKMKIGYLPELQHYISLHAKDQRSSRKKHPKPDDFVAVRLKTKRKSYVYIGKILQIDNREAEIKFLVQSGNRKFKWPSVDDISWQPLDDIIHMLSHPQLAGGRGIQFVFNEQEIKDVFNY